MEEVVCKIEGIVYSNRSTGFYVVKTRSDKGRAVTARGTFPGVNLAPGMKAKFRGEYEVHAQYGRQLAAVTCEVIPEKGRIGIITYLTNHVKSIGPVTAGKLYAVFGDDLVDVLENDPDQLRELDFLKSAQIDSIVKEWSHASAARTASIFLTNLGLSSFQVRSAYSRYGAETTEIVKEDPYKLYECSGIGFQTADQAAKKLGVGRDDPRRIRAMVMFIMSELSRSDGHMYVTSREILDHVRKLFRRYSLEPFSHGESLSHSAFYQALSWLKENGQVHAYEERLYLTHNWYNESRSAAHVASMVKQGAYGFDDLEGSLAQFEEKRGMLLSDHQRQAFMLLDDSRIFSISGFPGTGKTLLVSAFVHLFEEANLHYALMSPTGIAAKRLSQVTGKRASTIHRALGYKNDGSWEFNSGNPYRVDAVIVDEMSMVDTSTFYHLVSALPPTTILILVGDAAQLPSVGAGYVLHNLMACPEVPHVSLTRIYRQELQSDIVTVAHAILMGEPIDTSFNPKSDFLFLNYEPEAVIEEIKELTLNMKDRAANFQVIAPMYDGDLGVNNLNRELRSVLNPAYAADKAYKLKHGACDMYEGDRVMVVKNDYDRMVFNGDVGKVQRISIKDDKVEVKIFGWFDQDSSVPRYIDKVFTFKVEEARHVLRVAFACTAHKVQGMEFDFVVMPMTMRYSIMLYRNLIYTAITRAKRKVFLFGDPRAFRFAVSNDRDTVRHSSLTEFISEGVRGPGSGSPPRSGVGTGKEDRNEEEGPRSQAG